MWNRKAVRSAAWAIALVGILALASPALAGGLDDPGGPCLCDGATPLPGCEESLVVTVQPSAPTAPIATLAVWRWVAIWLLRH